MDENKIVLFCSKIKNGSELSNFSELSLTYHCDFIDDKDTLYRTIYYKSGEHAFHGQKYINIALKCKDENRKKELFEYAKKFAGNNPEFITPLDAKKGGGRKGKCLKNDEIDHWNSISENVQRNICLNKIFEHKSVRDFLKNNKDKYFLHYDFRAKEQTIWGGKINKDGVIIGQNKLGKIWIEYIDKI